LQKEIKNSHTKTGDLWKSIEVFEPIKTKSGYWIVGAYPSGRARGKLKKGVVYKRSKSGAISSGKALYNNDKLYFLEYGTSKQQATPVIAKANHNAESKVLEKLQESYNEAVSNK
jgi:hypothetical protein